MLKLNAEENKKAVGYVLSAMSEMSKIMNSSVNVGLVIQSASAIADLAKSLELKTSLIFTNDGCRLGDETEE